MSNLTIGWIILTFPVWILGEGLMADKEKQDYALSLATSAFVIVPIWWGIYFIVKNFTS